MVLAADVATLYLPSLPEMYVSWFTHQRITLGLLVFIALANLGNALETLLSLLTMLRSAHLKCIAYLGGRSPLPQSDIQDENGKEEILLTKFSSASFSPPATRGDIMSLSDRIWDAASVVASSNIEDSTRPSRLNSQDANRLSRFYNRMSSHWSVEISKFYLFPIY